MARPAQSNAASFFATKLLAAVVGLALVLLARPVFQVSGANVEKIPIDISA